MTVDVLVIEGCPHREPAVELVGRAAAALQLEPEVRVREVVDAGSAERERFLGSPTIRVDGRDVEPGADARTDFVHSCRIFRTAQGLSGLPEESWVREALVAAGR